MRERLRRQVKEPAVGVTWSDSELNVVLNNAYTLVQKEIRKVYPEAHIFWDYVNTVAGVSWYPLPATFGLIQVGLKQIASTSDGDYAILQPKRYRDVGNRVTFSGAVIVPPTSLTTQNYYTKRGQYIGIFPAPSTSAASNFAVNPPQLGGLQLLHSPIMSMSDDNDVPRIKEPLHYAIVYWAKILLSGETDTNMDDTRARLNELLSDLALWYDTQSDEPDKLIVSL